MLVTLTPHPDTPSTAVDRIEVEVRVSDRRRGVAVLALIYRAFEDEGRVRLPQAVAFGRGEGLWRHTCFEAFLKPEAGATYLEVNFSPSGEWASYAFDAYREGMRNAPGVIALESWTENGCIALEGNIDLDEAFGDIQASLRLGLSAVIEEIDGTISYWALAHPSDKPDFHHPDSFVLELP